MPPIVIMKDSRIAASLFLWALIVTILLVYRTNLPLKKTSIYEQGPAIGSIGADYQDLERLNAPKTLHGESPYFKGSCYCGEDKYCMCTPSLAIDAIIEVHDSESELKSGLLSSEEKLTGSASLQQRENQLITRKQCRAELSNIPSLKRHEARAANTVHGAVDSANRNVSIVLVYRRDPPGGFAIPGGFVEVGETVEAATIREVQEETNLRLSSVELFRIYSEPQRDKRRHTVSAVYRCISSSISELKRGDDAKDVRIVPIREILHLPLAFDHRQILSDYLAQYHPYAML